MLIGQNINKYSLPADDIAKKLSEKAESKGGDAVTFSSPLDSFSQEIIQLQQQLQQVKDSMSVDTSATDHQKELQEILNKTQSMIGDIIARVSGSPASISAKFKPPSTIYIKDKVVKDLSGAGGIVLGARLNSPNVGTIKTIAESRNVGIVHIDVSTMNPMEAVNLVNATGNSDTIALAEFKSGYDKDDIKLSLDAGMTGMLLKGTEDSKSVKDFLMRIYFPPIGKRVLGPSNANSYLSNVAEMRQKANDVMIGAISISSAEGAKNIESIIRDNKEFGLKLIMLDREALAKSLTLSQDSPEFVSILSSIEDNVRNASIALGTQAKSKDEALNLVAKGYKYITVGDDISAIDRAFTNFNNVPVNADIEVPALKEELRNGHVDGGNRVKKWLEESKLVQIGFLMTPDPLAAERLAMETNALWIDAEHGPFSIADVEKIVSKLPEEANALVRVKSFNNEDIEGYVKAGAKGIIAPNIDTPEQAESFVKRVKELNPDALAVVIIETADGVNNVESIAQVKGIDVMHIGPYDLATSLNTQMGSDLHKQKIVEIENAAKSAGLPLGGAAGGPRSAAYDKYGRGYTFLTTVSDQEAVALQYKDLSIEKKLN